MHKNLIGFGDGRNRDLQATSVNLELHETTLILIFPFKFNELPKVAFLVVSELKMSIAFLDLLVLPTDRDAENLLQFNIQLLGLAHNVITSLLIFHPPRDAFLSLQIKE